MDLNLLELRRMIKKVEIIFRDREPVWARGSTYDAVPIIPYDDGDVLFSRSYPERTAIRKVWKDIRIAVRELFYDIFYPAVIWHTARGRPFTDDKGRALARQSDHVQRKQSLMPEFYVWDTRMKKWHMNRKGYEKITEELGGNITVSVGEDRDGRMFDFSYVDRFQKRFAGKTVNFILFVYPDKYDEVIRAMFELKITFW